MTTTIYTFNNTFHSSERNQRNWVMTNYSKKVMTMLNKNINILDSEKNNRNLIHNTASDFSRHRKLNFKDLIKLIIFMAAKPIKEELYDYFEYDADTASSSAFVQARNKIHSFAFQELFNLMNKDFPCLSTFKDYHLLAVDGSELAIPFDSKDTNTFNYNGKGRKPTSSFHINSLYDILDNRYVDMIITGGQGSGEQRSICTMAERYNQAKASFIGDRNYGTWNVMEHIKQANHSFLLRTKDINSSNSLLKNFNFEDKEFDLDVAITLTNKQTNEVKSQPEKYRFISTSTTFDYVNSHQPFYDVQFRVVRFKIDGKENYESILTNLSREDFPAEVIKELYGMRWGIEVSFRHLTYSTTLKVLHAKKRNNILQEIWARTILYNLSMIIINNISKKAIKKRQKWHYTVNVTRSIHLIRDTAKRKGGAPPNLETIISRELLPIRPGRKFLRKVKPQSFITVFYRFS